MSEAKFTPGPWEYADGEFDDKQDDNPSNIGTVKSEGSISWNVAMIHDVDTLETNGQSVANAHLIAAAPELWAFMLEVINAPTEQFNGASQFQAWCSLKARKAIAKATGTTPPLTRADEYDETQKRG